MYSVSNILTGKEHDLGHALEWQQDSAEMAVKCLDRLSDIVRSNEEHVTFEKWITAGTRVNYAICAT
jgi:deoxyhypusine synthase